MIKKIPDFDKSVTLSEKFCRLADYARGTGEKLYFTDTDNCMGLHGIPEEILTFDPNIGIITLAGQIIKGYLALYAHHAGPTTNPVKVKKALESIYALIDKYNTVADLDKTLHHAPIDADIKAQKLALRGTMEYALSKLS